ncbi:MAG: hypothetical protein AAF799_11245 [Myxococcota bacterium]
MRSANRVRRRWGASLVGAGLLLLVGCKKDPPAAANEKASAQTAAAKQLDAAKRSIPDVATVVGGVDLAGLQSTGLWRKHSDEVLREGKTTLDALQRCKLGLEHWRSVTFGLDPEGELRFAAAIVAEGLGKASTLECAVREVAQSSGDKPWVIREGGKVVELDRGTLAYVIDDDTVLVVGMPWIPDVERLRDGKGRSAFDGELGRALQRTDTSKHVWFAGVVPAAAGKQLAAADPDSPKPKDIAAWLDLSDGVQFYAAVNVGSEDGAKKTQQTMEQQFSVLKGMATSFGVPAKVMESVKFDTSGPAVTATAKASEQDLETIVTRLQGARGGGS